MAQRAGAGQPGRVMCAGQEGASPWTHSLCEGALREMNPNGNRN